MTTLTSRRGTLEYGPGLPTVLINDRITASALPPEVLVELQAGRFDRILELADLGFRAGLDMVEILVTHPELDEVTLLPGLATAIHEEVGCPIALDSRHPQALAAALAALAPYKALILTVTAEPELLQTLLPIARRYGAAIGGLPMGPTHGLPRTAAGRLAEARTIVEAAEAHGIPRDDVVIDAMCLAPAAEPNSMQVTLETLKGLHDELGVATQLGISNAGWGLPGRPRVELTYLLAAMPWGLDSALVNPGIEGLIESVQVNDFLTGRDPYGLRYIQHHRAKHARQDVAP